MSGDKDSWIVVADDFTGAAELGAVARRCGYTVALTRGVDGPAPTAEVWVIDTDSRELPVDQADGVVRACGEALRTVAAGRRVFKKIDSVLRGNCAREAETLAGALACSKLSVVAGNPQRGREVRGGRLMVDGVALDHSLFAEDPTFPAQTAEVSALWAARGARGDVATEIADEVTVATLPILAQQALAAGALPVGGAFFFEACLAATRKDFTPLAPLKLPVGGGALLVCGSRAGWPEREALFAERGWPVMTLTRQDAVSGRVQLLGLGAEPAGEALVCAKALSEAAARQIARQRPALICLEGGATAAAVLAAMEWTDFELLGEVTSGTAGLRPIEKGTSLVVLVKPGSYAWPEAVLKAWESNYS